MEIKRILKKDGLLLVAVPNYGGAQSVFSGKAWFHLDVPRHYSHFTPKTIKKFLDKSGFQIKKVNHFSLEYDPFGFLQSLYNYTGIEHNLLYRIFRAKKERWVLLNQHKLQMLFILWTLPMLAGLSLILSLYDSTVKSGGCLELYCWKR